MKDVITNRFDSLLDDNKKYIKNLANKKKELEDKVSKEDQREFVKKLATDKETQEFYAQKLVEKATLGVESQLVFADFFRHGTISPGDPLYYTLDDPVSGKAEILEIAMNGGTPRRAVVQDGQLVRITPYQVTSPEVTMNKFTLKQGDISNEQKARERIEKGNANNIDLDAISLLESGLTDDLTAIDGIYIDERVKNFPQTNDIDLSAEDGITLDVVKEIASHFDQLGRKIRNVYIPSNRRSDLWDWMSIPPGYDDGSGVTADSVVPMSLQESIIRTGSLNRILGYNLNLIPLNTLNGDSSEGAVYIWVSTTAPAGEFRQMPAFSDVFRDEDAKRLYWQENRVIAMFMTPNERINYARIRIA
ncbi:MAG: hypothetical protein ACOCRK_02620 [bacterium]